MQAPPDNVVDALTHLIFQRIPKAPHHTPQAHSNWIAEERQVLRNMWLRDFGRLPQRGVRNAGKEPKSSNSLMRAL